MADSQGFARDEADPRKRLSPAAARNRQPILEVLQRHLPQASPRSIDVLELGAGTGEHAAYLAAGLPQVRSWQPTEYSGHAGPTFETQQLSDIFESIVAHTESNPVIKPPVAVDATSRVRHRWSPVQSTASQACALCHMGLLRRYGRRWGKPAAIRILAADLTSSWRSI